MKKLLLLCFTLCCSLWANAQATSLTIDCQTPGWLSSMINYGDQQTVKSLKVTGALNSTDLIFIGGLMQDQVLTDNVDISDADIVSKSLGYNCFGLTQAVNLKRLSLPKNVETISDPIFVHKGAGRNPDYYQRLQVDTLYFNCNTKFLVRNMLCCLSGNLPKTIIVGESVDSIPEGKYNSGNTMNYSFMESKNIEKIILPRNMRYIGDNAFQSSSLSYININELSELEYLGGNAFSNTKFSPDTLIIPNKIKSIAVTELRMKSGQHLFIGKNLETITNGNSNGHYVIRYLGDNLIIHMNRSTPPNGVFPNNTCTVIVPKGAKDAYLNSNWKDANIVELNPVEEVILSKHDCLISKGESFQLSTTIEPVDADDQAIEYTSLDGDVASVNKSGNVTGLKSGQTYIYAISTATGIKDSCLVTVRQPVSGITVSPQTHKMSNIGECVTLEATVLPNNATNKGVTWRSSNENVSIVARGKVVATGYGTAVIYATTEDGGYMDFCTITVEDATAIRDFKCEEREACEVRDLMGNRVKTVRRGQMYIRNGRKFIGK